MTENPINITVDFIWVAFNHVWAALLDLICVSNDSIVGTLRVKVYKVAVTPHETWKSEHSICDTSDVMLITFNHVILSIHNVVVSFDTILGCYRNNAFLLATDQNQQSNATPCFHFVQIMEG